MITNSLGEGVSRRDFMPFGEDLYSGIGGRTESLKYSLNGVDSVRKRFTGYQKDQETGLDFAEARYYNSSHGRFTAVDPLLASGQSDNPQSFNRYAYVMNSPTKLIDPSGLLSQSTSACGQCGFKDDFKGLETFQQRVDYFARTGINFLTKSDMALLQFHISNGTALGYSFANAAQRQIRPVQPRRGRRGRSGRGATWEEGTGPARTSRRQRERRTRPPYQKGYKEYAPDFAGLRDHWRRHAPTNWNIGMYLLSARSHIKRGGYGFRELYTPSKRGEQRWGYVTRTGPDTFIFTSTNRNGTRILTHMIYSQDGSLVNGQVIRNMGIQVRSYPENFIGPIGADNGRNE